MACSIDSGSNSFSFILNFTQQKANSPEAPMNNAKLVNILNLNSGVGALLINAYTIPTIPIICGMGNHGDLYKRG